MKRKATITILFSLALALSLSGCYLSFAQDVQPPPGYSPPAYEEPALLEGAYPMAAPNSEKGADLYQEKCQGCHGDEGLGDGPDSTGLPLPVAQIGAANTANPSTPLEWYSITYNGKIDTFMPWFSESLSEQEIWDVLGYVYSFSSPEETLAVGEAVFSQVCAACHGPEAQGGADPTAANLLNAERMVQFSIDDVAQKMATGSGNDNHVFGAELDAAEQEAVALYVRSLIFPPKAAEGQMAEATPEPEPEPTPVVAEGEEVPEPTEAPDSEETDAAGALGLVTGLVTFGSEGELPEGLTVSLEVYEHFEAIIEAVAEVKADGTFTFEDIPMVADYIYIAVVEYDGLFYPSTFYVAQEGDSVIDLPVVIYGTTEDTSALIVSRMHVFLQFVDESTVQVIHQVTVSNLGNEMVSPERDIEPALNFSLPEGYAGLIFQQGTLGEPYVLTADGFGDPTPILPGENSYELVFGYQMPYDKGMEWSLPINLPTQVAVVFVEGEKVKVTSDQLEPSGTEALNESVYQVFVTNQLAAGENLALTVKGKVASPAVGDTGDNNWVIILIGSVGLALAGFGAWYFFRPVKDEELDLFEDEIVDEAGRSEDLIDEIIALDEKYGRGEIEEDSYQARRQALKDALRKAVDED